MVKIVQTGIDEQSLPIFTATEVETGEPVQVKNWFEKSKNKWHIVLGQNSANRKYIAHNEFKSKAQEDETGCLVYVVEDKTTGPRVMGTAQPDRWAIPYMTDEEKADYDRIIAAAKERRQAEVEAKKAVPLTEKEKLEHKIAKLTAQIAKLKAAQSNEEIDEEVEG